MSEGPIVSIVTPSLNQDRYVEAAVLSVLEQDYPRLEYVVMDGGSTDGTLAVLLNPWNCDLLQDLEREHGRRVYTVLQLRLHPSLIELRRRLLAEPSRAKREVVLTYLTSRGGWYLHSWNGDSRQSGGLATNIGIQLLRHVAVDVQRGGRGGGSPVGADALCRVSGTGTGARAVVPVHCPRGCSGGQPAGWQDHLSLDDDRWRGSGVFGRFGDLHRRIYEELLAGRGFGIEDIRPSTKLVHDIREEVPVGRTERSHALVGR